MASEALKLTLAIAIFIFGVSGVLTPRLFDPFGSKITYANLMSCGVIISAALVHLLDDATESLNAAPLPRLSGGKPYPWSYMICGLSFILLFFFERLLIHHLLHDHHHHGHDHHHSISLDYTNSHKSHGDHSHHHKKSFELDQNMMTINDSAPLMVPHHSHHHGVVGEHFEDMATLLNQRNYFSAIILMMGLGVHSILSGLALGSSSADSEAISLGVAILSHKYLASFAVGVPLNKSVISLKVAMAIALCFSMLTPIGIAVGYELQSSLSAHPWISDIFICIAAGTFLYVSICEIMIPEFSEEKKIERDLYQSMQAMNREESDCTEKCDTKRCQPKREDNDDIRKMGCVLMGFAVMSVLAVWL